MLDTGLTIQSILQNHKLTKAESNGNELVLTFENEQNNAGNFKANFRLFISTESSEDNLYVELNAKNLYPDSGTVFQEILYHKDYEPKHNDDIDEDDESDWMSTITYSHERFEVVAEYIRDNYSTDIKIADVCSGNKAELTKLLRKYGYNVTAIDPNLYDEDLGIGAVFTKKLAEKFDLLVAIYACGFTDKLITIAKEANKPLILFPCPCSLVSGKKYTWIQYSYSMVVHNIRKLVEDVKVTIVKIQYNKLIKRYFILEVANDSD